MNKKAELLSEFIAPNNNKLGLFLPYAPVHHLLFETGAPDALVMTSANDSSEPITCDDNEAGKRWGNEKIALLTNNRPIHFRDDDSVVQVVNEKPILLRGGRGYSPHPIPLPIEVNEPILAMGGDLKSCFTLVLPGKPSLAVVSPYIGDLEHPITQEVLEETIERYLRIFDVAPKLIALDKHPRYFSSLIGRNIL